tara:strand:+ start:186 stop:524 length:339 start_codon:yes stop_codon:yes gene_type:complete
MALTRYLTEMGMGVDVHGRDYTKAACRAVSDALRHSSLNFFKALGKSHEDMRITVKVAVSEPEKLDVERIASEIPYGSVTVDPCKGGLDIDSEAGLDPIVVANAGIIVCFEE